MLAVQVNVSLDLYHINYMAIATIIGEAMFRRQRKPKIFGFKNAVKRGMRKILTFVKLKIVSIISRKIILKPL